MARPGDIVALGNTVPSLAVEFLKDMILMLFVVHPNQRAFTQCSSLGSFVLY